jgi:predicted ATP-binding protein involved in virulence
MQNVFISKIHIEKVRHLRNIDIVLSETERKHLILTGKNGSGKTSLLEAIRNKVIIQQNIPFLKLDNDIKKKYNIQAFLNGPDINIFYSTKVLDFRDITFVYKSAERSQPIILELLERMFHREKNLITENNSREFFKYVINLDYQLYVAKSDKNTLLAQKIEKWFDNLLITLRDIYDCQELELKRDAKNLAFTVEMPGREPFRLNEMADGYAAFLDIYMELLMRFENMEAEVEYGHPAIVLIDEIETHLHVELQKRVLPFLTKMFPKVQFITATHSPFVINALENAVIFDLEKKERLENPSFYSYETIIESFLDTGMYSNQLKIYFERYKELCFKKRTPEENEEFLRAKAELEIKSIPSTELYIMFQELEKKRKADKNDPSV